MERVIRKARRNLHVLMLAPAVLLFFFFFLLPIVQGMCFSFTNWDGFGRMQWIGLQNYFDFFTDDRALNAVKNTLYFGVLGAVLLNVLGLAIALLLDEGLKGSGLVRTLVYMPTIISSLIMGYIWGQILSSEGGILKTTLEALSASDLYSDWLSDPKAARVVLLVILLWQSIGGTMMIYISGLQSLPESVHEAAIMDGAGYFRELLFIKLPLLGPSLRVNIITNLISCMSIFDVIMSLTGGGPGFYTESLSLFIYKKSVSGSAGYASAIAIVLFLIILVPVTFSFLATKKMEDVSE
ncbi:MAG: sugar ABC transporter permease [Faecalibacterium sp.]|jgi:raffinose/stachyose/melibiose transport system permease protein|nr:sugar ABC transporter permease [Faecalibacterium sp.]